MIPLFLCSPNYPQKIVNMRNLAIRCFIFTLVVGLVALIASDLYGTYCNSGSDVNSVAVCGDSLENKRMESREYVISALESVGCVVTPVPTSGYLVKQRITSMYLSEVKSCREKGFVRVYVDLDQIISFAFDENEDFLSDWASFVRKNREMPCADASLILQNRMNDIKEMYESDIDWEQDVIGEKRVTNSFSISYVEVDSDAALYSVDIPVKSVEDVFCYLPFGGGDCPGPQEHRSIAKYWYEKYGAVPCYMAGDVLQFYVEKPIREADAEALAREQYAYCVDIVDQGCNSIWNLADALPKSKFWFFWWD